ncbi:MAG: prolyl-tRNA synthetase associated domain-containing protein [Oscillospiraceae bacterium]|nr:prolyl-tRNA synthetase associated domain-containing protein [Oscillospiraceae bacterium]
MPIFVDRNLYKGRPDNMREDNEMRCYDVLDELGIEYYRADHEHADTIEDCHVIEEVLGHGICKNLFLTNRQKTEFYLLLMPGDKPFKTKFLSKQLGTARLSFADADAMGQLLNVQPGSVSVLGILNDNEKKVHLVMDREVYEDEYICCHPCRNTSTLKIAVKDIIEKVVPYSGHDITVVELAWEIEE